MPSMMEKKCAWCRSEFQVRVADHNRGWGRFCSKSCKASEQEKRNGQHAAYLNGRGVSNLHPERLKEDIRHGDYVSWRTGEKCDPFDDDGYRYTSDDHPFSSDGLGQE